MGSYLTIGSFSCFVTHMQDSRYRLILVDGFILSPVFVYKSPLCFLPTRLSEQTVTFLETTLKCAFKGP